MIWYTSTPLTHCTFTTRDYVERRNFSNSQLISQTLQHVASNGIFHVKFSHWFLQKTLMYLFPQWNLNCKHSMLVAFQETIQFSNRRKSLFILLYTIVGHLSFSHLRICICWKPKFSSSQSAFSVQVNFALLWEALGEEFLSTWCSAGSYLKCHLYWSQGWLFGKAIPPHWIV